MISNIIPNIQNEWVKTTADATATVVAAVHMNEGEVKQFFAEAVARNSDGSVVGSFRIAALFYRNASGDVTITGATQDIATIFTAASTITFDLVANATDQTVEAKVTGEAGVTFNWKVTVTSTTVT